MTPPRTFWCEPCRRWTYVDEEQFDETQEVACEDCGEPFGCDECGFEIGRQGECLRREAGAEGDSPCPNSV